MTLRDLPVVGWIRRTGADDPVFDALLALGPILIVLIGVFGRSPLTVSIAAGYLAVFVATILYKSVAGSRNDDN